MKALNSTGFTLIEIIIASSIAVFAAIVLTSILIQSNGLYIRQNSKINQGVDLNFAASKINEAVKQAIFVATNYTSPQGTLYTTGANTLVLAIPAIDASQMVIEGTYDFVVITKDDQKPVLRRQIFPAAGSFRKSENLVLTTNLSDVSFLYYDNTGSVVSPNSATRIKYTINLSQNAALSNQSGSITNQINLKNN